MAEQEYRSNSHKSREEKTENESRAVTKNKPAARKPDNKYDAKSVIFNDLGMILGDLKDNVFIPGIIDLTKDIWDGMGDSLFETITGKPSSRRSRRDRGSSYHSYDGYYRSSSRSSKRRKSDKPRKKSYGRYSIYELLLDKDDAEDVLDSLLDQIDEYGFASVKDYYDFADFNGWEYTDYPDDWGWDDLDENLEIDETRDADRSRKYILRLPKPKRLD